MGGLGRQSYAAFAGSMCIISFGMSYGWLSPVIQILTDEDGEIKATAEQVSWIAADIEIGCLLTPFFASYLMDKVGRKWPMLCTVPFLMISWIVTITTRSVVLLYVKRVLDGMVLGLTMTIAPIYLAEIANADFRGSIVLSITVSWYAGILIQYCLGTYLSYNAGAWINLALPVIYFVLFSFLPESPYYLMMKKQEERAVHSLAWFRNAHPNEVSEEITYIAEYLEKDAQSKESWQSLFTNRVHRRCLLIMFVVSSATMMTGLTTVYSYASEMFAGTGSEGFLNPDTCSVAIAILFFITNVVICFVIDRIGRRPLVIISTFGCFLSNLASAAYHFYKDDINYKWIPLVTIGSYCFFVSIGLSPVMTAFQGELFHPSIKSFTSGLILLYITLISLVALKLYYIIGTTMGMYVNYLVYAAIAGLSTVWFYFYVPETKNKTFSELFEEFERIYNQEKLLYRKELQTLKEDI